MGAGPREEGSDEIGSGGIGAKVGRLVEVWTIGDMDPTNLVSQKKSLGYLHEVEECRWKGVKIWLEKS